MDFNAWLNELNAESKRRGYAGADEFWQGTGADCWRPSYDDGMTPVDALADDASYL
jgi:hypothetical protein